jgi:hypothetical protein
MRLFNQLLAYWRGKDAERTALFTIAACQTCKSAAAGDGRANCPDCGHLHKILGIDQ